MSAAGPAAAPVVAARGGTPQQLLALQRMAGNAAVSEMLSRSPAPAEELQRLSLGSLGSRVRTAGRAAHHLGMRPVHQIDGLLFRWKRHRATRRDVREIEAMAAELGYGAEVAKPTWEQDRELVREIEQRITEEAIDRGLTVNF